MLAPSHPLHLQRLDWARDHVMTLPPQLRAGMVAWTLVNGTASPACILDLESVKEDGAYAPFVRVSPPPGSCAAAAAAGTEFCCRQLAR